MSTIQTLAVKLIGDITEYQSAMNAAEQKARTTAAEIGTKMQDIGKSISGVGRGMTMGLTLPLVAIGGAAVNMASDLEETRNKVSVVFGDMSGSVLEWSKTSATAMGQSQNQALAAAATYGNLFVTMGLGQEPAADMSMSLVGLAADLASFNNANPADVLQAMQSGLVGQVEPLRKYGVVLSEAAVQAKAMELGLVGADGELSEAAKLQARYAIVLAQTGTAQGDFARTADGLANSTRIAKAQLADAGATLGQQLLPYALQAAQFISRLVSQFQALSPATQKVIVIVGVVVAAIGPLLMIVGSLISAIGAIIPIVTAVAGVLTFPLIAIIAAVIAIAVLLYAAWKNNWGGIQEKTQAVIDFIKGLIEGGMQFISDLTSGKLGWISEVWNNTWNLIKLYFDTFVENIKSGLKLFKLAFSGDWTAFGEELRKIWDRSWNLIKEILSTAWENIKTIVSNLVTSVISFFRDTDWGAVGKGIIEGIVNGIVAAATWLADAAVNAAKGALDAVKGFLGIESPSTLFEMQIGWQMGAGMEKGLFDSVARMAGRMPGIMAQITPRVQMPALAGAGAGGRAGGTPAAIQVTVNNPLPERASTSVSRELKKLSFLGVPA